MTQAYNLSQFANNVNTSGLASLTTAVTGTLPIANGGTGSTSTTYCNLASNVTGTLPVANGGTGTTTPSLVAGTNITISGSFPNQTINASGGAPTTAQVLSATAGASAGAVGTYALCAYNGGAVSLGSTVSSLLNFSSASGDTQTGTSGTWRCMATSNTVNTTPNRITTWLRIS
jgi:hypothetical protein